MTLPSRPLRSHAVAKPWPDRWLADAATRRGLPGAERLIEFGELPTAWEGLLAAGALPVAVLELACLISATKSVDLSDVGAAESALLPASIADKHGVVPVRAEGPTLIVA